jgi:hypothetical protein
MTLQPNDAMAAHLRCVSVQKSSGKTAYGGSFGLFLQRQPRTNEAVTVTTIPSDTGKHCVYHEGPQKTESIVDGYVNQSVFFYRHPAFVSLAQLLGNRRRRFCQSFFEKLLTL